MDIKLDNELISQISKLLFFSANLEEVNGDIIPERIIPENWEDELKESDPTIKEFAEEDKYELPFIILNKSKFIETNVKLLLNKSLNILVQQTMK